MKKILLVVLTLSGFFAVAQHHGHHGHGEKNRPDFTPEQVAELKTKKMTLALDLSEAQQQEVEQLELERANNRIAKMEERKALKNEGKRSKEDSDSRFEHLNERLDQQIAYKAQIKEILSAEQFSKWENLQQQKHMRGYCGFRRGKG